MNTDSLDIVLRAAAIVMFDRVFMLRPIESIAEDVRKRLARAEADSRTARTARAWLDVYEMRGAQHEAFVNEVLALARAKDPGVTREDVIEAVRLLDRRPAC